MVSAGEVLLMVPRVKLGRQLAEALRARDNYVHGFFSEDVLAGDPTSHGKYDVQEAFTLLKLLVNSEDRVALRAWCGFGSDDLRANQWDRLRKYCEASGESPNQALARLTQGEFRLPYTAQIQSRYGDLQQRLQSLVGLRSSQLVDALFPLEQTSLEHMRTLALSMLADEFDVGELFEWIQRDIVVPEPPVQADFVRVMTLYKAKGLTAKFVAVAGCVEGQIPYIDSDRSPYEQDRLKEEQRRLFYVAVTRSAGTLVVSSFIRMSFAESKELRVLTAGSVAGGYRVQASRFLHELGPTLPAPVAGTSLLA
jgi:DNA helicase-2/ATP-dependent DNA helicase PcrA